MGRESTEPTVRVEELDPSWLDAASALLIHLNERSPAPVVRDRLATILRDHPHYKLFGAFRDDQLIGLAGAWIATKVWCGRYLEIDNFVVDPDHRSGGAGTALVTTLEALARESECSILVLDSYSNNHASHRLYHRLGFEIWGFHFVRQIGDYTGGGGT